MKAIDLHGRAILDFYKQGYAETLFIRNTYGEKEEMPVEVYFREGEDLTLLELEAIKLCRGHILDVGAGAGAISLILQNLGNQVTALESSPSCCQVMKDMGVKWGIEGDIWDLHNQDYDTILLLMNGIGMCGTLKKFRSFVKHLLSLLKPGGTLIFDTSDISYLYEGQTLPLDSYYGNLSYQFEYKGERDEWFSWLYIDFDTLKKELAKDSIIPQKVYEDQETGEYLIQINKAAN